MRTPGLFRSVLIGGREPETSWHNAIGPVGPPSYIAFRTPSTHPIDILRPAYSEGRDCGLSGECYCVSKFRIRLADSPEDRAACLALRLAVFVEEQGVPESLERDDFDAEAAHFLAVDGEIPVGTARLIPVDGVTVKAGRVAVLAERRGSGIGASVMAFAEDWARSCGFRTVVLSAQEPVVGFYELLGYTAIGERFFEAGIPHFKMTKEL